MPFGFRWTKRLGTRKVHYRVSASRRGLKHRVVLGPLYWTSARARSRRRRSQ